MDAFFSSVLGKMSQTFGRSDDIDDDGTMKMADDLATAMAQRPDELFERMKPPSSRRGVSGDDDDDDDDDDESCIVHKNGPKSSSSPSWTTTSRTKLWLENARTRTEIDRKTCHENKVWHRSAHVWVFDKERNRVLCQKRSEKKDTFPGMWDISAAGHIEFDPETQGRRKRKKKTKEGEVSRGVEGEGEEKSDEDEYEEEISEEERMMEERTRKKKNAKTSDGDNDDEDFIHEADKHSTHPNSSRNTAAREIAEELGINVDPKQLTYAFTCAAKQADMGGCNAYEDVYFMHGDSSKDVAETFPLLGKAEVDQVAWFSWEALVATWNKEYFAKNKTQARPRERFLPNENSVSPKSKSLLYEHDKRELTSAKLVPRNEQYVRTLDEMFKSVEILSSGKVSNLKSKFENARDGRLVSPLKKPPPPKKKTKK
jgi:isopentenyldiphosphate isomerase